MTHPGASKPVTALVVYGGSRGTTAKIANAIVEGMQAERLSASSIPLSLLRMMPSRLESADIVGIGSPVYFLREPPYVTRFLSGLGALRAKKAFVFCTCGMDRPGETLERLGSMVRRLGPELVGAARFRTAMSYFPYRKRGLGNPGTLPDEAELASAHRFGREMARAPEPGSFRLERPGLGVRWKARLLANLRFRRAFFPGVELVTSTCTGYGSCLSRCPVEAIARHDGNEIPDVGENCIQCLECISDCPRGAIVIDSALKEWISTLSYRLRIH
jgi:ferredoxin